MSTKDAVATFVAAMNNNNGDKRAEKAIDALGATQALLQAQDTDPSTCEKGALDFVNTIRNRTDHAGILKSVNLEEEFWWLAAAIRIGPYANLTRSAGGGDAAARAEAAAVRAESAAASASSSASSASSSALIAAGHAAYAAASVGK